jgi:hypothetical protein
MHKYKANKEVSAARIVSYTPTFVVLEDGSRADIEPKVHEMIVADHRNDHGYLVVYKDNHVSYAPKGVFEETYQIAADKKAPTK